MKSIYLLIIPILFFASTVFAEVPVPADCTVTSTLKLGSKGAEVQCLQAKVGAVADGNFGPMTKAFVATFQSNNKLVADGIVGPMTRLSLNNVLATDGNYPAGCTSFVGYSITTGIKCDSISQSYTEQVPPLVLSPVVPILGSQSPKVFSVSPEKVRSGDTVKIYGENFASTGNTVRLRYGQIEDRFGNLPSSDGKLITFVFQPPEVKTMNKQELLDLPPATLNQILDPVKAVGGSIDDIVDPYRNMKDEGDLRKLLNNNGHSFDELYDKFYVTVENVYGKGSSDVAILSGLRKLSFGSNSLFSKNDLILGLFSTLSEIFTSKKAYAQTGEGGTNSGIISYCTCGSGYMTNMVDFSSNGGSGPYWWAPGYRPSVGNPEISGAQLGLFIKNGGICAIGAQPYCAYITMNIASTPWGEDPGKGTSQ